MQVVGLKIRYAPNPVGTLPESHESDLFHIFRYLVRVVLAHYRSKDTLAYQVASPLVDENTYCNVTKVNGSKSPPSFRYYSLLIQRAVSVY